MYHICASSSFQEVKQDGLRENKTQLDHTAAADCFGTASGGTGSEAKAAWLGRRRHMGEMPESLSEQKQKGHPV